MGKSFDFDGVVIGAGIAGFVAAVTLNGLGKKVALVEKRKLGGNCTSFTCLPSKALIRSGTVGGLAAHLDEVGLCASVPITIATDGVMSRVRSAVQRAQEKDLPETFEQIGIRVLAGTATFIDRHHVSVDGRTVSARFFIIASGTVPFIPPIEGLNQIPYYTNETIFTIDTLPRSVIILGGGVAGLEFASAFSRLGVQVTVVEIAPQLLPTADYALVERLAQQLTHDGIRLMTGTKPVKFSQEEGHPVLTVSSDQSILSQIHADAVLITSGRTVMLDELGLERAGVEYTPKGVITTNTLRTTASNIYACGDVVGPYQLASTAEYQGIIAATNAVLPIKRKAEYHNTVFVACTNPPIAQVGLTEEQALKQYGGDIRMYQFDYGTLRRALADSTPAGLAKIICTKNGAIIGAHILGEAAGEIIHELQIIRAFKKPLHSVYLVSHAYPTYTQAIVGRAAQLAFLDHMQDRFWVKAGLKVMPGLRNKLFLSRYRLAESDEPVPAFQSTETSGQELDVMPSEVPLDERSSRAFLITDDICRVTLPSRLNYFDEQPLLVACEYGAEEKEPNLMLDFSRVECMNGLGASMLVKLANAARLAGRSVAAFGLNRHYRHVLNLTGLDQVIRIYDTQEDALTAYGISLSELPVVTETEKSQPLDVNFWAPPVGILRVPPMPPEARNWNVHGLRPVGPVNGFGQLWQKIYQLRISNPAIRPEEAILALKEHFHRFQPPYNRFYPSAKGIRPGEIILINASTPGGPIATGVMVLYADNNSFTFITPQGHPESGWITFSAFRNSQGTTVVQFLSLARANDPVYEGAFRLTGSKMQVRIWTFLLRALADYLNSRPEITVQEHCVDSTMQWSEAGNIWYNAQIRTLLRMPSLLADKLPKRSRRKQRS